MHVGPAFYVLTTALDTLLLSLVAVWIARRRPRLPLALAAVAVVAGLLALRLAALVTLGLSRPFGVAHVLWLDAVVALPLAALALALAGWRGGGWPLRLLALAGLLLAPVGAYASFVEPRRLVLERTEVPLAAARDGERPIRVAVLADLQFDRLGAHERDAVALALEQRPDLILLPGDYIQGTAAERARELPKLRRLLGRLRAPGGVFAVQGDQESPAQAHAIFAGTGVRLLADELVSTRVGDRRVTLAGLSLDWRSEPARAAVARLETEPGDGNVRLLLAHRPDALLALSPGSRADLLVAGHTHGGQLRLPLLGPLETGSTLPREVGAGGLHTLDGRRIYVSRGVGVERGQAPKLRLGAPPEVSLLELR